MANYKILYWYLGLIDKTKKMCGLLNKIKCHKHAEIKVIEN